MWYEKLSLVGNPFPRQRTYELLFTAVNDRCFFSKDFNDLDFANFSNDFKKYL